MSREVTLRASKGASAIDYNITETTRALWDPELHFQFEFIELTADSGHARSTLKGAYPVSMIQMGTGRGEVGFSWVSITRCTIQKGRGRFLLQFQRHCHSSWEPELPSENKKWMMALPCLYTAIAPFLKRDRSDSLDNVRAPFLGSCQNSFSFPKPTCSSLYPGL